MVEAPENSDNCYQIEQYSSHQPTEDDNINNYSRYSDIEGQICVDLEDRVYSDPDESLFCGQSEGRSCGKQSRSPSRRSNGSSCAKSACDFIDIPIDNQVKKPYQVKVQVHDAQMRMANYFVSMVNKPDEDSKCNQDTMKVVTEPLGAQRQSRTKPTNSIVSTTPPSGSKGAILGTNDQVIWQGKWPISLPAGLQSVFDKGISINGNKAIVFDNQIKAQTQLDVFNDNPRLYLSRKSSNALISDKLIELERQKLEYGVRDNYVQDLLNYLNFEL